MAKGQKRLKILADKRASKAQRMKTSGGKSNYSKKAAYLKRSGGFGSDFIGAKPWRSQ